VKGLAVIVLDALDIDLIRRFDLDYMHNLYMENGNILTCSTYPHTQTSWIMLSTGNLRNLFWIYNKSHRWVDPARNMDHTGKKTWDTTEDVEIITYRNLKKDENIGATIWEVAEKNGVTPRVQQVPIVLPPYSYNTEEETEAWFPNIEEQMRKNRVDKHRITMDSLRDIADGNLDFYITSFPHPDKALHGVGEGLTDIEFATEQIEKLDDLVKDVDRFCEENDIGYVFLGDHGAPGPDGPNFGEFPEQRIKVVRHRKQSVVFGNIDTLPRFTHEMFGWMCGVLDVDPAGSHIDISDRAKRSEGSESDVVKRLGNLGYI